MDTRTSYAIYPRDKSGGKHPNEDKITTKALDAKNGFNLLIQHRSNTWTRSPPGSYLDLDPSSWNSDVVFHARFPRRLGGP
jgi:hypothetical protein